MSDRCPEVFTLPDYPLVFECRLDVDHSTMCYFDSEPRRAYRREAGRFTIEWWPEGSNDG